jgi:NitT/TauT family transport system ATP-binding protein
MVAVDPHVKLRAEDVSLTYQNARTKECTWALDRINLDIRDGEFVSVVGPSGCGKTTFLNVVDGLIKPTLGRIMIDGKQVSGPDYTRAVVFQSDCLLPWRTVLANIGYGLELRGLPKAQVRERARAHVELVGLTGFESRYPHELSGGMRQRVNLARALACDPVVLLLDEPFAALDAQTREFMQYELLNIWAKSKKTALFVTHQINEAVFLSDRVIVLSARPGRVKADIRIDIPRPRKLAAKRDPRFLEYEDHIWALIEEDARKQQVLLVAEEA